MLRLWWICIDAPSAAPVTAQKAKFAECDPLASDHEIMGDAHAWYVPPVGVTVDSGMTMSSVAVPG
jgi:hypothetical protein